MARSKRRMASSRWFSTASKNPISSCMRADLGSSAAAFSQAPRDPAASPRDFNSTARDSSCFKVSWLYTRRGIANRKEWAQRTSSLLYVHGLGSQQRLKPACATGQALLKHEGL